MRIPRTRLERAIEVVGVGGLIALAAFAFRVWPTLPDAVPIHFGLSGRPDAWGRRDSLAFLLAFSFGIYGALSALERIPHLYNYPVPLTAENARQLYLRGRQLVLGVKVIVLAVLASLFCAIVLISRRQLESLSVWFLPIVIASLGVVLWAAIATMVREAGRHNSPLAADDVRLRDRRR